MSNSLHDLKKAAEAKRFRARAGRVDSLSDGHDAAAGDGEENWQSVPHLPAGEAAAELTPPSMALEEMAAERLTPRQLSDDDFTSHNMVMPPMEPAHSQSNGQAGSPLVSAPSAAPVSAAPAASPAGGGASPPAAGGGGGDGGESGRRPWTKPVAGTLELGLPHSLPTDAGDISGTDTAQDSTAELNPPLRIKNGPWLLLLAALLVLGGGAYYWWQYQTLPVDLKALQVPKVAIPVASLPEVLPLVTAPSAAPSVASAVVLPGTTETRPVIQPLNSPVTRPAKASRPRLNGDAARVEERSRAPDGAGVHFDTHNPDANVPLPLMTAYRAFQDGNYARAEENYRRVLQQDPRNRDALLGMAALAVKRGGAGGEAAKIYRHILALYPRDATAQAGLYALSPGSEEAQSGLQQLARQQPAAAFTLANLYAGQSRWSEAQSAYFLALSQDGANADYAFNLAVSLEHLQENKMAARYYRQALQHSANKTVSFDRKEAEARLKALETP